MSEAIPLTESKDPVTADSTTGDARNFRTVVRFFDDHETEVLHEPSLEAVACKIPARQCHVGEEKRLTI